MAKKPSQTGCACGSGSNRSDCCGRFLDGYAHAQTAAALMRSRYTAFVEHNADYLQSTWHPEHRPTEIHFDPNVRWLGLSIRHTEQGGLEDVQGVVEFIARSKSAGNPAHRHHERSYFAWVGGRWLYRYGDMVG